MLMSALKWATEHEFGKVKGSLEVYQQPDEASVPAVTDTLWSATIARRLVSGPDTAYRIPGCLEPIHSLVEQTD